MARETITSLLKKIVTKQGEQTYLLKRCIDTFECMVRNQERRDEFYYNQIITLHGKRKRRRNR